MKLTKFVKLLEQKESLKMLYKQVNDAADLLKRQLKSSYSFGDITVQDSSVVIRNGDELIEDKEAAFPLIENLISTKLDKKLATFEILITKGDIWIIFTNIEQDENAETIKDKNDTNKDVKVNTTDKENQEIELNTTEEK